jgi:hypothetical protein
VAWAFSKGSPYFEVFNHHLKQIIETGIVEKLIREQVSNVPLAGDPYWRGRLIAIELRVLTSFD